MIAAVTLVFQIFSLKSNPSTIACFNMEYNITFVDRA